jgi:tRNA-specific 2-thiouridylase
VNWLAEPAPRRCTVKLRAREVPHAAEIHPTGDGAEVWLDTPSLAAPGQACVFYDGDRVLGGGFITAPAGMC